ncbi:NADH-quinone oxidoreductase subunit N [Candidatus Annandia adelgestsuga]|uniref:NADH-quinone oxidoreductase subunit N n=1 Tax=Candidatus Annandia adelgestsuga TaxID=1302411 RepID=A0A3S9J7G9_9ENTR|nr:proton-conducting transporter membrane subunit [Candidatus Annandia adelgestsuga]AZP36318.1 NADH-quinone oxidoreductase subunit N [Candidatus Annandia adelgestsuga]
MEIFSLELLTLIPIIIIELTIVILILLIIFKRSNLISLIITNIGLISVIPSIFFIKKMDAFYLDYYLYFDNYAFFYISLLILSSFSTCIFSYYWLKKYKYYKEEFYLLILISTLGGIVVVSTMYLHIVFIGLELLSLPIFGLINFSYNEKKSLNASIKYTILSLTSSSLILFGLSLIYIKIKSLDMSSLILEDFYSSFLALGFIIFSSGLFFKLSLVPFNLWTPDIYKKLSLPILSFLSSNNKIVFFALLTRMILYLPDYYMHIRLLFMIVSCASMIFGSLMIITQKNINKIIGYSSISQIGYLMSVFYIIKTKISSQIICVFIINYVLSNLGIFSIISIISNKFNIKNFSNIKIYKGLFWRFPIMGYAMTIMFMSLAGLPITLGFLGKFYIIFASLNTKLWWLTFSIIISSVISIYAYLKIIINLYDTGKNKFLNKYNNDYQIFSKIIFLLCFFLIILLGIYPEILINESKHIRY